jgi:UDP-glucose 4-epimerase
MDMKRALVTGGAGFIGSTLAERLAAEGIDVVLYDDFSSGSRRVADQLLRLPGVQLVEGDILDGSLLVQAIAGCDTVFHLAANADVRDGLDHPELDIEQNTLATVRVLEAMRASDARRIVFTSTGSVYGEPELFPTPEHCPFPVQTSLYATSKLAAEGLISSYCHAFGFTGVVFRLVSILGERYSHGHVLDFHQALRRDPTRLTVLGDGRQEKSYLYVGDCVEGMLVGLAAETEPGFAVYNLGTDETITVDESLATICAELGADPDVERTGGRRGWPGDSPLIRLDCSKVRALGWQPTLTIREAIVRTLRWLEQNPSVVEEVVAE